MQVILDISANTHKNDKKYLKRMIDEIVKIDTKKHEIIFKHQLFQKEGNNLPLKSEVFSWAWEYAKRKGYKTTASVFDVDSLDCLLRWDIPFVKIANRRDLYHLVEQIPRTIPVYISYDNEAYLPKCLGEQDKLLYCISKYPSEACDYQDWFKGGVSDGISDHRVSTLPMPCVGIWEKHYKLPNSTGPDAGEFAITPRELKEIL